jgi:hypothetical protein
VTNEKLADSMQQDPVDSCEWKILMKASPSEKVPTIENGYSTPLLVFLDEFLSRHEAKLRCGILPSSLLTCRFTTQGVVVGFDNESTKETFVAALRGTTWLFEDCGDIASLRS